MNEISRYSVISLFCGPGGFDEGFKQAGFTTRLAYDVDEASIETHNHNHPEAHALRADLSRLEVEAIVAEWNQRSSTPPIGLIGGPPCQPFSTGNSNQKESDPRYHLPEFYAAILRGLNKTFQFDFFVFENVPGLVGPKHLAKFTYLKELFEEAGFKIAEESIDAQHYGVPQRRRRVFVIGINSAKYPNISFALPVSVPLPPRTVREAIDNLPEPVYFKRGLTGGIYHPNHWCMFPKSVKFQQGLQLRVRSKSFRLLEWNKPSYTVAYGHNEVHIHPDGKRRLSVLEAMLLQGFSQKYVLKGSLTAQNRLVSEAVPPPVASMLAKALIDRLGLEIA